jgi:N-acetylmuramoyl-L-alanine amidase
MKRKICCLLLLLFIAAGASLAAGEMEILRVEAQRDRGFDYLDIYTSGYVKGEGLLLEDKLVIDFPKASVSKKFVVTPKRSARIKKIVAKQGKGKARIVIYLKKNIDYEVVNVFGKNKSVIEISDRLDYTERIMAAWEKENLKQKAPALQPYKYKTKSKVKKLPLQGRVIVIDPGHGGADPGAYTRNGIPEKHLTLNTARKLARILNNNGATVYLTRNKDRTVSIRDIVGFANKVKADILVSIHYNYYGSLKRLSGTETYYYARRSRPLALALHRGLVHGIQRRDRGLRRIRYYILREAKMPAVIVEPLYISNPEESRLAQSAKYQYEIAQDIAGGVKDYFRSRVR